MTIPNRRIPGVRTEVDNTLATQGAAALPYRALIVGQKMQSGTWTANTLNRATSADQVATGAGRGSLLHLSAQAWFAENQNTETWFGVLADNSSGVVASGTATVAGTATAAGTISLYVGGRLVEIAVASGDTANTIAAAIATAVGKYATGTVTMSAADAADNVTIGATTFVGTTGAVTPGAATYSVDTGNTEAATSLAAQVNAHAVASTVVTATSLSAVVTLRAVAAGTAGNSVVLTTTDAVDLAVSGSGTLSGATADTDYPVHASVSSAVVTFRARHRGAYANEIDLRYNYQTGEALPAGVTLTLVQLSGGTTAPVLTTLIANMGDIWFHVIAHPYTDATSLTAIETELASRFGNARMIDGVAITAKSTSLASLSTLGDTRNSPHSCIVGTNDSPTPPFEYAASVAAVAALYGSEDAARPFQTLPLTWVKAPASADEYTGAERNVLLYDGISTTKVASGGVVQIERLITTYQTNAAGSPDESYLDVTTMLTVLYLRYTFRTQVQTRYPRHKLVNDGTRVGSGQKVISPKLGKAEALIWFRQMEDLALVENFEQFARDVTCIRDTVNRSRLKWNLPADVANGFILGDVTLQFRL